VVSDANLILGLGTLARSIVAMAFLANATPSACDVLQILQFLLFSLNASPAPTTRTDPHSTRLAFSAPCFARPSLTYSFASESCLTRLALEVDSRTTATVVMHASAFDMMTIRRLSIGSGYKYLLKTIAVGDGPERIDKSDLVRYYSDSGTPPGVFLGAGLVGLNNGLGVAVGHSVSAENLQRMLQDCADPITGEVLGRVPSAKAVGGFDLTFSPSKSVSVAWALADHETREVIYRCHQDAIEEVLAYAEREVFHTRTGQQGCVEEDIVGVVAASFTHFDSRDGDPQLHDHVVILNRVQAKNDGAWRTLDSRGLFASTVMLSEMHQGVLSDLLTAELGWDWEAHTRRSSTAPKWEVAGVSKRLMDEFSQRTTAIVGAKDRLIAQFEDDHGRAPTDVEVLKLRQTATLSTRRAKKGLGLGDLTEEWTARSTPYIDNEPMAWVHELGDRGVPAFTSAEFEDEILLDVANAALDVVSAKRPTFSRANVQAEVFRQMQGVHFTQPAERILTATRTTNLAIARALLITIPNLHHTPRFLLRTDGTSKFLRTGHWLYTTTTLLDAEARLLDAGQRLDGAVVSSATVAEVTERRLPGKTFKLSVDQALAVEQITTSGRALDLLVGPAGTGKSTAMAGLRAAWEAEHGAGSVTGLAPSAAAAQVLGDDMGIDTDNLAKWLYEHRQHGQRSRELEELREEVRLIERTGRVPSPRLLASIASREEALFRWILREGQLIVIDEASLASTFALDELTSAALDARAKVVLVGDGAQLSSVDAGGMFRTLVRDRGDDAPTLADVRRFNAAWEKEASLGIRNGTSSALGAYATHERIADGTRDDMLDALYDAWRADNERGLHSLMLASDSATVNELNARARAERIARGAVVDEGVDVAGAMTAGVNDLVVTRENNRRLTTETGWVKNGDVWTVSATHPDGSMTVTRVNGDGSVILPASYVAGNVELAYATTVHRAQGRTVDSAHAFVSPTTTREVLYVALTRGSEANHLYVDTHDDPDPDTGHDGLTEIPTALQVLTGVLHHEGADVSATDMIRQSQTQSIAALVAEYNTIVSMAEGPRWEEALSRSGLSDTELAQAKDSPAYAALLAQLRDAENRGFDIDTELPILVTGRSFDDADDVASVLHHRIDRYVTGVGYPSPPPNELVAGIFPRPGGTSDSDVTLALDDRADTIEQRGRELAMIAIESGDAWVQDFGDAPSASEHYERWVLEVAAGAAYLDRWAVDNPHTVLDNAAVGHEQEAQRSRVLSAVQRAYALTVAETAPARSAYIFPGEGPLEPPSQDFGLDL
jgi:conjugative relaxase-like TrwC/TraI family protein